MAAVAAAAPVAASAAHALAPHAPLSPGQRFRGSVLSIVTSPASGRPSHGFICVTRRQEPGLWAHVQREAPETMRKVKGGHEVATIVFQAADAVEGAVEGGCEGDGSGKGEGKGKGKGEGETATTATAQLLRQLSAEALAALPAWAGAEVTFESEMSGRYKRYVARRVLLVS